MWIEFSDLNFKLLVIFIFPISKIIEEYIKKTYLNEDNKYFKQFRYFTSYTFAIIFVLIVHHRSKKSTISPIKLKEENEEKYHQYFSQHHISEIELVGKDNEKKRKIKSAIFLLILCAISLLSNIYKIIFVEYENDIIQQSIGVFLYIGFLILLSFLILKQKLYKHHFVSAIIIAFVLLILFFILILLNGDSTINFWKSVLSYILYTFNFSLYDVLRKKYMNIFNHTPYFIMFIIGLINVSLLLIFDIFTYYFNRDYSGIIIGFQKNINNVINSFELIITILFEFIANIGIFLTIYYFTPCHYFISEYIKEFFFVLIKGGSTSVTTISLIIAYLINMFFILVFNEIIILNFWKLDYNTKKRIQQRMTNENSIVFDENGLTDTDIDDNDDEKD